MKPWFDAYCVIFHKSAGQAQDCVHDSIVPAVLLALHEYKPAQKWS
jgi:hypothetical protein